MTARLEGRTSARPSRRSRRHLAKDVKLPPGMTSSTADSTKSSSPAFANSRWRSFWRSCWSSSHCSSSFARSRIRSRLSPVRCWPWAACCSDCFITKTTLNVVSLMGMIMVVGIVAKNGILMLDAVEDHLARATILRQALLRSGRRRFRPVLDDFARGHTRHAPARAGNRSGRGAFAAARNRGHRRLAVALLLSLVVTPTIYAMLRRDHAT